MSVSGIQFSSHSYIGREGEGERKKKMKREKVGREREREKKIEKNFEFFDDIDRVQISLSVFFSLTIFFLSSFFLYYSLSLSLSYLSVPPKEM